MFADWVPAYKAAGDAFSSLRKNQPEALEGLVKDGRLNQLSRLPALAFFRNLSGRLSTSAIVREPKPMNYFKAILAVDIELQKELPDWVKVKRIILNSRGAEFHLLLDRLNSLRLSSRMREYYQIICGLLRLKPKSKKAQQI